MEAPSLVMFSYKDLEDITFSNYHAWHWVLNGVPGELTDEQERKILRPERTKENWLHAVCRPDGPVVQAHVRSLDLAAADQIWCRSQAARKVLVGRGFDPTRVKVKRLPVDSDKWSEAIASDRV